MKNRLYVLTASAASLCVAACAAAPRAPATSLSEAGVKATTAFAAQMRTTASQMSYADALEAYSDTWVHCRNPNLRCEPQNAPPGLTRQRQNLVRAISARGEALDALRGAYEALGREAAYNEGEDLAGAGTRLVNGVNQYVAAVSALGGNPIPQVVTQPVAALARIAFAGIGEARQRRRIIEASRQISAAATALRDGLREESRVFDSLAADLISKRARARVALMQGGLVSRSTALAPLAQHLNATLAADAEQRIAGSAPLQAAVEAAFRALSAAEIVATQQRYQLSIEALTELLAAHERLEADQGFSLAGALRAIAQIDAALAPTAPPAQP